MTELVIDASVFVQLFLEEASSGTIGRYFSEGHEEDRFIAPSILASETAAAITKKLRRREIGVSSAREAFANLQLALSADVFELLPANEYLASAFELSVELHHPLHDCIYLAVARTRSALLATRDSMLSSKARKAGIQVEGLGP